MRGLKGKWMLKRCKGDIKAVAKNLKISETLACILINRGIETEDKIKRFMNPSLEYLHNPLLMKDMDKGTDIIKNAILEKRK